MGIVGGGAPDCIDSRTPVDSDVALPLDAVAMFPSMAELRIATLDPGAETSVVAYLGDGSLHHNIWPSRDDAALRDRIREAVKDVVAELSGSFSAEHGIGLTKRPTMERRKDPAALALMRQNNAAMDSQGVLNVGKVVG